MNFIKEAQEIAEAYVQTRDEVVIDDPELARKVAVELDKDLLKAESFCGYCDRRYDGSCEASEFGRIITAALGRCNKSRVTDQIGEMRPEGFYPGFRQLPVVQSQQVTTAPSCAKPF